MSVPGAAPEKAQEAPPDDPPADPIADAGAQAGAGADAKPDADAACVSAATGARLDPGARVGLALFAGFVLLAITNAMAIAVSVPWPVGGLRVRLLHHAFDAATVLGLGLFAGLLVGLWVAFVRAPRWVGLLAYFAVSAVIMRDILGRDLYRQACIPLGGRVVDALYFTYVVLCGLAIPVAHVLGAVVSGRRWLRWVAIAIALGGIATAHILLRDDYHGVHGAIVWAAATLSGAAAAELVAAAAARVRRPAPVAAALGLSAALGLVVPPPNAVRLEMFREPCAIGAWALARTLWSPPRAPEQRPAPPRESPGGPSDSPWWRDRATNPPVPPTRPKLAPNESPVVVFITIDAMRADAVADRRNARQFPTLSTLQRTGANFGRVTSPGSQTAVSLSSVFSSRYFSQLVWEMYGKGSMRFPYPARDPARRFPEILTEHGVETVSFCGVNFLAGEYGVTRGFKEERVVSRGRQHALATAVINPMLERLGRAGDGPLFVYGHLMEPHAPYDRGTRKGTDWERYLAEIRVADLQVGRVLAMLKRQFRGRGYLLVSSDHGEAFGEHATRQHTKNLYEEMLRVPLLVWGPGVAARRIEEHVGLIDMGPTILDLFDIDTPAAYMGQSLVPLLAGRYAPLDRPLLAEGRLRRALYRGSLKIIDDPRRKVVEAFDLARDPGELVNLFDDAPPGVGESLAALRGFFAVHRAWKPGYVPIYKP